MRRGWHRVAGRIRRRSRTFKVSPRTRRRFRIGGYRINPELALYGLNPHHRRRRRSHHAAYRRHRRSAYRHHYHHNPGAITALFSRPMAVVVPASVGVLGAVGSVTVGNWVGSLVAPYLPAGLAGTPGSMQAILVKAVLRTGVTIGADRYLPLSPPNKQCLRIGAGIAIVGSALLEFMGKQFVLGANDQAQLPGQYLGLAGYVPRRLGQVNGLQGYVNKRLGGYVGGTPVDRSHDRLYGGI
jgi:hypothetical protein